MIGVCELSSLFWWLLEGFIINIILKITIIRMIKYDQNLSLKMKLENPEDHHQCALLHSHYHTRQPYHSCQHCIPHIYCFKIITSQFEEKRQGPARGASSLCTPPLSSSYSPTSSSSPTLYFSKTCENYNLT